MWHSLSNFIYLSFRLDSQNYIVSVSEDDIALARAEGTTPKLSNHGCSEEFLELVSEIMSEKSLTMPQDGEDARGLFKTIMDEISNL